MPKAKKKAEEVEELEELDEELEELDEEEADEAPTKKTKKKAADDVVFGVADLAKLLSEGQDKAVTTRELRTLIRKMARDGSGRVDREIKAGNRTRYSWSGPKDPEVKAIIKAFNDGELEADKKEKLAKLKEQKAAKQAEKGKGKGKGKKKKEVVEDDDLELDDDE